MQKSDKNGRRTQNEDDQAPVACRMAEQIARNARERGLDRPQMVAWASLICRMAVGLYDVEGKRFDCKLTFTECRHRKEGAQCERKN